MAIVKKPIDHLFIVYWDCEGFQDMFDLTELDRQAMWDTLKESAQTRLEPVPYLVIRAKVNSKKLSEVWTFHSKLDKDELLVYTNKYPQEMMSLIREHGSKVFVANA